MLVLNSSLSSRCEWILQPVGNQSLTGWDWIVLIIQEIGLVDTLRVFPGANSLKPAIFNFSLPSGQGNFVGFVYYFLAMYLGYFWSGCATLDPDVMF